MEGSTRELGPQVLLQQSEKRWESFPDRTGPALAAVKEFAQHLAHSGVSEADTVKGIFSSLESSVMELICVEREANARREIFGELRREERVLRENDQPIVLKNVYQDLVRQRKDEWHGNVAENSEITKDLRCCASAAAGEDEDEDGLLMGTGRVNVDKCPITRAEMMDPLKNTACVHTYSTAGIVSLISQANGISIKEPLTLDKLPVHARARCPVAPCTQWVSRDTLKRDFTAELTQRQNLASQLAPKDQDEGAADLDAQLIV